MRRNIDRASSGAATVSSGCTVTLSRSAAQLEPLELQHLRALLAERVADLLGGIVDPLLVDEHVRSEEALVQHPLNDLVPCLLRLRLHLVRPGVDLAFLCDRLLRDVIAPDPVRS